MTFYLVTTAWATARRKEAETGIFDWGALVVALAAGTLMTIYGFEAALSPTGLKDGYPPVLYFIWGAVVLLCAAGDVRMLVRGGSSLHGLSLSPFEFHSTQRLRPGLQRLRGD
jgi:hypothetical protein